MNASNSLEWLLLASCNRLYPYRPPTGFGRLFSTYQLSISEHVRGAFGQSRYAVPQTGRLKQHMCGWLRDMMPSTPSRHYVGFKDLVGCLGPLNQTLALFGPKLRILRSFRRNVGNQVSSIARSIGRYRRDQQDVTNRTSHAPQPLAEREFLQQQTAHMFEATSSYPNVFDLPLEEFSVAKFNELLSFLDIGGCKFTRVLHANDGARGDGFHAPDVAATRGLLDGTCTMAFPLVVPLAPNGTTTR